jgi:uncharacterized RDD family membrane protein YckC
MSRARPPLEQGSLFDLELDDARPGEQEETEPERPAAAAGGGEASTLDVPLDRPAAAVAEVADERHGRPAAPAGGPPEPGPRLLAGALDAALHVVLAGAVLGILAWMRVPLEPRTTISVVLVVLLFSFLYTVISLAFWGATPAMAALDLRAEATGGEPLEFGQAARRWAAGIVTCAAAGLPALLVLSGRSLGDRWSGSAIVQA